MNVILDFLTELFTRLGSKSPKFIRILQGILTAGTLVLGLPAFLQFLGVTMPLWAVLHFATLSKIATIVVTIITSLQVTVDKDALAKKADKNNITVEAQELKTLPFTTKND